MVVEAGESIPKITCKGDCVPSCTFQWTQYNRKRQIYRSSNAVLDLGNAASSTVGYYICEAYNYVGPDKHTASLKFQIYVRCMYTNMCPKSVSNILRIHVNILHYTWRKESTSIVNSSITIQSKVQFKEMISEC